MPLHVVEVRDPDDAYAQASEFLIAEPTLHNVLLTVLGQSRELSIEGRFWIARDNAEVVGFAMQSPPGMRVGLARAGDEAIRALVDAIGPNVPGVLGLTAGAAVFAGHFAERHHVAATADDAGRIYELGTLRTVPAAPGALRLATPDDRPTLLQWSRDFSGDTGSTSGPTAEGVDRLIARQQWRVWDNGGAVSMVRASDVAAGVVRVGYVYTPPEHRGNGYATASVGQLSAVLADQGLRCVLYTQLSNPTSNAIYRRLGYDPIAEVIGYDFAAPA